MKANGFLCRSHAATAVCLPGDPRSVIIPRRPDRRLTGDLKYSRLLDNRRRLSSGDRSRAVTLPMVMKKKRDAKPRPPPPPPPPPPTTTTTTTTTTAAATTTTTTNDHVFQVVVMRVSIHCQGCAGKVRKLISKMEGVTSFSIDLESKRVTVMGHVSPVGVLESISRVKKAEFWPC